MDALDAILKRRSIRRYQGIAVTDEQLKVLLEAAMAAPSAGNQQPWRFVVVTARETLDALAAAHPYAKMLHQAPAAVVVCGDTAVDKHPRFWPQDCAAATQNLLVAATALGLGSCWVGVHPHAEREAAVRKVLDLPAAITPLALVALGYAAEEKGPVLRYNDDYIHREKW